MQRQVGRPPLEPVIIHICTPQRAFAVDSLAEILVQFPIPPPTEGEPHSAERQHVHQQINYRMVL